MTWARSIRGPRAICANTPRAAVGFFAAPCQTDAIGFVYRRDWFTDLGEQEAFAARYGRPLVPPDTWEEFRDLAEFFHRPEQKRYGCSLLTGRGYDSIVMAFSPFSGLGAVLGATRKATRCRGHLNTEGAVAGLEFSSPCCNSRRRRHQCDYFFNLEAFSNGSTAWCWTTFRSTRASSPAMGDQAGFFKVPRHEDSASSRWAGRALAFQLRPRRKSRNGAKQFIAWFSQTAIQKKWIAYPGSFTANTEVAGERGICRGRAVQRRVRRVAGLFAGTFGMCRVQRVVGRGRAPLGRGPRRNEREHRGPRRAGR